MKRILSYGAGVNSTAILVLALQGKIEMPDWIIFSDTGAEWPETYRYMNHLESKEKRIRITYITGGNKKKTLIDFCREKGIIPSALNRWCSDEWKIIPVERLSRAIGQESGEDHIMWIGIDAGESHRAGRRKRGGKKVEYPLIELGIDRSGCRKLIKEYGLGVPVKSGCYICPYQSIKDWIRLKRDYPELWKIVLELEKPTRERGWTYRSGYSSIEEFVAGRDKQKELGFPMLDQKCQCYFD